MIWLKRLAISIFAFFMVIILLFWLAVGRFGSPALLSYASSYVPELTIDNISGGLSSTLIVESLNYSTETIALKLKRAELTLRWRCLVQFSVCADSIKVDGLDVDLLPSSSPQVQAAPTNEVITLPLLVAIDSLNATNSNIKLPDKTLISLDNLETELRFYQRLRVLSPRLDGLSIIMPISEPTSRSATESLVSAPKQNIQLDDVFVPINAEVSQLQLLNISFKQHNNVHALSSLKYDGLINGHQIVVNQLQLVHNNGTLDAEASATLSNSFPIDATLKLDAGFADMPNVMANLTMSGSLQELTLNLKSESPLVSSLEARVEPLNRKLPIDLSFNWETFSNTDLAPIALPNMSIKRGMASISGDLDDYSVLFETSMETEQLPTPATINLDSLVNLSRVDIRRFDLSALEGNIQSTGLVKLNENVSWELSTVLEGIQGQLLDHRLPTNLNGKLEYQGQLVDGKPNFNIKNIDINATQQGYPLVVSGSGAFAGNVGVAVGNLMIAHKKNNIQGFARMLIDRRVDADLIIAVEALGDSLPGYEGEVRGNLMVMGEPTAPNIEMSLDAYSIAQIDEQGNRVQIADSASLRVNGTNTNQQLTLDYVADLLDVKIQSNIELEETLWKASIDQASIKYKTISAEIEENASIRYIPATESATIDKMCWEVNTQGEACLDRLHHQAGNTDFSIRFDDIVINEWLKLTATPLPLSTPNAQFSALVQGSYSPDNGLVADVDGEVTDSEWQIGNREQNLIVNIDPARFTASANNNLIVSEAVLTSSSIGKVEVRAEFDTTPEQQTINAELIANKLLLAPFAYLSEDINRLDGVFDTNLRIKGNINEPEITGSLKLADGVVDIARAPSIITDWNANVSFEQFTADYSSEFNLGGGLGKLNGRFSWEDQIALTTDVIGEQLNIQYQDINVSFSPDVSIEFQNQQFIVNGSVTVPKAKIALQTLPENAITPSSDVHLRGEPEPTSAIDQAQVDLQILIDPDRLAKVELDAFGLNANLAGQLRLTTQPAVMGFGDLQILNGQYRAYGQELVIRTGEVQFNGPLSQPLLFIEAIRDPQLTEDGVIAGLAVDGLATQPNIRLFSEPSMDQSQNLTYLLTGSGNMGGSGVDDNAFAGLLIGLGVSNSGGLTGAMGDALGINDLRLSSKGSGSNTQVSVSGTIAPNLTLEYGVGLSDSVPEVKLRYQLLPKLFVEATSGLEQSLVLYYQFAVGEIKQDLPSQTAIND